MISSNIIKSTWKDYECYNFMLNGYEANAYGKYPLYFNGLLFNTMPGNN